MDKHGHYSVLESAIRVFKTNIYGERAIPMIYVALMTEKLFFPVDDDGNMITATYQGQYMLPVFSSWEKLDHDPFIYGFLNDHIDTILSNHSDIIINPNSVDHTDFILPFSCLSAIFNPTIEYVDNTIYAHKRNDIYNSCDENKKRPGK